MKLVYLIETLAPIHALQKELQSTKPKFIHLVNVRLQAQFYTNLTDDPQFGPDTSMLFSMLSATVSAV